MRIRFNLGRGDNYMKWKVELKGLDGQKVVHYLPKDTDLTLIEPTLCNKRESTDKIFNGGNKRVCSWIECKDILVGVRLTKIETRETISFNPRRKPYWTDWDGHNLDGNSYNKIVTEDGIISIIR